MIKNKVFSKDESASYPGKFVIRPNFENFHLTFTSGSYSVLPARLMGLTYANYLRMCRDCFGAEIIGKGSLYPIPYFPRSKELEALIDNLNARADLILWNRENPDFKQHEEYVKEKNPSFYKEVRG